MLPTPEPAKGFQSTRRAVGMSPSRKKRWKAHNTEDGDEDDEDSWALTPSLHGVRQGPWLSHFIFITTWEVDINIMPIVQMKKPSLWDINWFKVTELVTWSLCFQWNIFQGLSPHYLLGERWRDQHRGWTDESMLGVVRIIRTIVNSYWLCTNYPTLFLSPFTCINDVKTQIHNPKYTWGAKLEAFGKT